MDLNEIEKNYARFDDEKLIRLATKEINSLRKEVIPILAAELAKRNISITNEGQKDNEENIEKEIKQPTSKEKVMSQMAEFMNEFETPHILKAGKKYFVNISLLFIISILFTLILLFLFKSIFGSGIRLIIQTLLTSVILTIALKKLGLGKIAEIKPDKIIFSKYPSLNFGVFRILVLFQMGINANNKLELDYKNISRIYQKNDLIDKGFYIETVDNLTKKDYRIFLEVLSEYDRKQIMELIKMKIKEHTNVA